MLAPQPTTAAASLAHFATAISSHDLEKGGVLSPASRCLSEGRVYPAQFGANPSPRRRRVSLSTILLPVSRGTRHSIRSLNRSRGLWLHACAHQLPVKLIAGAPSHHQVLSPAASSDGFKTIGKAFADGQNLFARGSKND